MEPIRAQNGGRVFRQMDKAPEQEARFLTALLRVLFEAEGHWLSVAQLEFRLADKLPLRGEQFESLLERVVLRGEFPLPGDRGYRFNEVALWLADKLDQRSGRAPGDAESWNVADELRRLSVWRAS